MNTIEQELADCRAAWALVPDATAGVHIHHEAAVEMLTEPIEARIAYILRDKPEHEQALRLRLMRPITAAAYKTYRDAVAPALKAYDKAFDPAYKAYRDAIAAEYYAYREAVDPAYEAYRDATAAEYKAYRKAVAPAYKAYRAAIDDAHAAVCPITDCPWDGKSIFGGAA